MKIWHFSETAYPYLPPASEYELVRVDLPNRYYDPKKGAEPCSIASSQNGRSRKMGGLEIMLNEHHQTPTCVDPAGRSCSTALARVTKTCAAPDPRKSGRQSPPAGARRRGNGVRRHPVAWTRRGRFRARRALRDFARKLQPGLHQRTPVGGARPHHQGLDHATTVRLATKAAFSMRGGSTSGRGRTRSPQPPIWVSHRPAPTAPPASVRAASSRRPSSPDTAATKPIFEGYRRGWRDAGRSHDVPIDRLAYAAFAFCRRQRSACPRRRAELLWHIAHQQDPAAFRRTRRATPRSRPTRRRCAPVSRAIRKRTTVEAAVELGIMFAGTPRSGAPAIRQILRSSSAASGICWWPANRASSATRKPCTASRCWRARCCPSFASAIPTRRFPASFARPRPSHCGTRASSPGASLRSVMP